MVVKVMKMMVVRVVKVMVVAVAIDLEMVVMAMVVLWNGREEGGW